MDIERVGIVGCGFMGSGIAQVSAQAGYEVIITAASEVILQKGLASIDYFLSRAVQKGKMSQKDKDMTISRIKGTIKIDDLGDCDLVIEVVPEDLELKKKIFTELDRICPQQAILTSNTFCLPVTELAAATRRPDKVLGTHFMAPVPTNRLLELVQTIKTSADTLSTAEAFGKSLHKEIIIAKDTPGFVFNRLSIPWQLNGIRMLETGINTAENIDASMTIGLNYPLGPIALSDFIGLDVTYMVAKAIHEETNDPQFAPPILLKRMVAAGLLGRKSGKGFYDYSRQDKT